MLNANASVDFDFRGPLHMVYTFDYAYNLAYNYNRVNGLSPVNNFGGCPQGATSTTCPAVAPYEGGNQAFMIQASVGYPLVSERWQWNVYGGYRHIDTDAVVDAFNDPDFYLGGTDAKGFHIGGNLGIAHNAWFNARWFSGTEVTGQPLSIDVLQLDLNARF